MKRFKTSFALFDSQIKTNRSGKKLPDSNSMMDFWKDILKNGNEVDFDALK